MKNSSTSIGGVITGSTSLGGVVRGNWVCIAVTTAKHANQLVATKQTLLYQTRSEERESKSWFQNLDVINIQAEERRRKEEEHRQQRVAVNKELERRQNRVRARRPSDMRMRRLNSRKK